MIEFFLLMDDIYVVHMAKKKVNYNLWSEYQQSSGVSKGGVLPTGLHRACIVNGPGVAGAVLQSPPSLINYLSD